MVIPLGCGVGVWGGYFKSQSAIVLDFRIIITVMESNVLSNVSANFLVLVGRSRQDLISSYGASGAIKHRICNFSGYSFGVLFLLLFFFFFFFLFSSSSSSSSWAYWFLGCKMSRGCAKERENCSQSWEVETNAWCFSPTSKTFQGGSVCPESVHPRRVRNLLQSRAACPTIVASMMGAHPRHAKITCATQMVGTCTYISIKYRPSSRHWVLCCLQ